MNSQVVVKEMQRTLWAAVKSIQQTAWVQLYVHTRPPVNTPDFSNGQYMNSQVVVKEMQRTLWAAVKSIQQTTRVQLYVHTRPPVNTTGFCKYITEELQVFASSGQRNAANPMGSRQINITNYTSTIVFPHSSSRLYPWF